MRALFMMSLVAVFWAAELAAEATGRGTGSAFKSVTPPKAGTKKRITIQIAPQDMARQRGETPPPTPQGPEPQQEPAAYGWFWQDISPELAASGPGRLGPALLRLGNGPSGGAVQSPRLDSLQQIVAARGVDILRATVGTAVSPALVLAVIAVESGGKVEAQSAAGAQGLMQLMPATAARFGVQDVFDPAQNIAGGVAYLDFLMKRFEGDPILALAGYNAGENAVLRAAGVPPYAETRAYVPKVLAAFKTARGLCLTPPELASDGCVFRFQ